MNGRQPVPAPTNRAEIFFGMMIEELRAMNASIDAMRQELREAKPVTVQLGARAVADAVNNELRNGPRVAGPRAGSGANFKPPVKTEARG
jgi:hypothetical protein